MKILDLLNDESAAVQAEAQVVLARLTAMAGKLALEEMASGFAHELNQPLGAIATYAQAGERMLTKPEPMIAAAIDTVQQISNEALGAGEGIRHIRKLFNRESPAKARCSIGALLRELQPIIEALRTRARGRLVIDMFEGIPDVHVDRLRIQYVLFTMVQNAFEAGSRDATLPPAVKIAVTSDRYAVEISVIDNGVGISADVHSQIFRPFFTTKVGGRGLSLASSRSIVEMHEGTIGFESTASDTRFWLTLPAFRES